MHTYSLVFFFCLLLTAGPLFAQRPSPPPPPPPPPAAPQSPATVGNWAVNPFHEIRKGDFTLEAWIKMDPTARKNNRYPVLLSTRGANPYRNGGFMWYLRGSGNRIPALQVDAANFLMQPNGADLIDFMDGECHHLAVVRDTQNNQLRFYGDGTLLGTCRFGKADFGNRQPLLIGEDIYDRSVFPGEVFEVRIWHSARTAAEIGAGKDTPVASATKDLVSYYPNQKISTTIDDASGNYSVKNPNYARRDLAATEACFSVRATFSAAELSVEHHLLAASLKLRNRTGQQLNITLVGSTREPLIQLKSADKKLEFDLSDAPAGNYTLTITTPEHQLIRRLDL